jgi:hypothetical protein
VLSLIHHLIVGIGLLSMSTTAMAAKPIAVRAPNCSVSLPPANAGEDVNHGALMKIYPRKSEMGPEYTGCQSTWIEHQGNWVLLSVFYFERGLLRALRMPHEQTRSKDIYCWYKDSKLEPGSSKRCFAPAQEVVPSSSYAPGCMEQAISKGGVLTSGCLATLDTAR